MRMLLPDDFVKVHQSAGQRANGLLSVNQPIMSNVLRPLSELSKAFWRECYLSLQQTI